MQNVHRFVVFCVFVLAFIPIFSQAQSVSTGMIEGKVVNRATQQPVVGATVVIVGTKLGGVANANGKFMVRSIPSGVYNVRVSALGFDPFIQSDVVVSVGKPVQITVELKESVVELKGVEVEASYYRKTSENITSSQLLNAEDVRRAPGVQEDVIRAVALLPGVGVTQAGRNDLVVRGGAPFENLFVVDNIEVPNINHFGTQGSTGGPLSLINIDFVRETQFTTGGFGAKYGDRLSSVTSIALREGNSERISGKATLSATGFGVSAEGPTGNDGTMWLSVRRSYLDFIFKAAGFGFVPEYWDFQTKVTQKLDNKNSLSFLTIGALNSVSFNNSDADKRLSNSRVVAPSQQQYFSGLTWRSLLTNGFVDVTLGRTYTNFETSQIDTTTAVIFRNYSTEGETSLRADLVLQATKHLEIGAGTMNKLASTLHYDLLMPGYIRVDANGNQRPLTLDTNFSAFRNATYLQASYSAGESFRATLGIRSDYYGFLQNSFFLAPRLGMTYSFSQTASLNASVGRFYQPPSYIWLIGDPTNSTLKPLKADQIVLGYEHILQADFKVQAEAYFKNYDDYPARVFRPQSVLSPSGFDDVTNDIPYGLEPISSVATGVSRGFELLLQKKMGTIPCYGLVSISVNETKFTSLDGVERTGAYDSRIIFNVAGGYRFSQYFEVSAKFRYATGLPTTPFLPTGKRDFSRYNEGERLPDFHGLDVRADKRWDLGSVQLVTYIDIQNIYGRQNVSGIRWNSQKQEVEEQKSIGLLPSIGVSVEF